MRFLRTKLFNFYFNIRSNWRLLYYEGKSNNEYIGRPIIKQPSLFIGLGQIKFGENTQLGYFPSPYFYNGYSHIEARTKSSKIIFGKNIIANNNLVIVSEIEIKIDNNVLIGTNVEIVDSDFHNTSINRKGKSYNIAPVHIKSNVWIGSNVKILKGVTIGENSIISNSSVVTKDIPENSIYGGIPARFISKIIE